MADPVRFVGANLLLKGNGDNVLDMQVRRNGPVLWSCWELTDEELLQVIRTRRMWIGMYSGDHAPFPVRLTASRTEVFPGEEVRELTHAEYAELNKHLAHMQEGRAAIADMKKHGDPPKVRVETKSDYGDKIDSLRERVSFQTPPPSPPLKNR